MFTNTPLKKFLIDLAESAVIGAASAVLLLPDSTTARAAVAAILFGVIGALQAAARRELAAFLESRKAS